MCIKRKHVNARIVGEVMKEYKIGKNEANQRFDKYLHKLLKEAGSGFLYKMLRKKNITLNGKKADGTEKLKEGDVVKLFLSDETFQKFSGETILATEFLIPEAKREFELSILYEDDDILNNLDDDDVFDFCLF